MVVMKSKVYFPAIAVLMVFSAPALTADRLELDNTAIIGSRELPKVLYIVPWKKSRIGTLAGVSEKGSFKESMTALDRDVFLRELDYYRVLNESDAVFK
ncbi:MAG: hypothetical protein L0Z73_07165 [Gammaproteobacteria bacterium]|nr:hypothetical protein [Gammaproteobacteria bacterium]